MEAIKFFLTEVEILSDKWLRMLQLAVPQGLG